MFEMDNINFNNSVSKIFEKEKFFDTLILPRKRRQVNAPREFPAKMPGRSSPGSR